LGSEAHDGLGILLYFLTLYLAAPAIFLGIVGDIVRQWWMALKNTADDGSAD
jgi:hypothetical protein